MPKHHRPNSSLLNVNNNSQIQGISTINKKRNSVIRKKEKLEDIIFDDSSPEIKHVNVSAQKRSSIFDKTFNLRSYTMSKKPKFNL